jgi:hypothetical protein
MFDYVFILIIGACLGLFIGSILAASRDGES